MDWNEENRVAQADSASDSAPDKEEMSDEVLDVCTVSNSSRSSAKSFRILHLKLKKEPFDLICSGKKTLEYRDATPYWDRRLMVPDTDTMREFDFVHFRNGYRADSPSIMMRWVGTTLDPSIDKFVIALGPL